MEHTSIDVCRASMQMALTRSREDEQAERARLATLGIRASAVDFGGGYLDIVKKIIERAVVAAQRQGLVNEDHIGAGAVAGATHSALEQIASRAAGLHIGGKIGIARHHEHICVAIYAGVGVLHLNEVTVGLAHRSLAE